MSLDPYRLKERLGGVVTEGGRAWLGPGPGHSPNDRSLSVRISDDGRALVHSFSDDDFRACADYLGLERQPSRAADVTRPASRPVDATVPDPRALSTWRAARADGEVVAAYLRGRGITIPVPPSLRQGADVVLGRTPCPMMVAAVQAPDRRVVAIHRTFLTWRGAKASIGEPRKGLGRYHDGAVRLGAAGETLGLAEGIESALSAMQLTGVPVWASLGAQRLAKVWIPETVRELAVFADGDGAGQEAARETARRWSRRGVKVAIRTPPAPHGDWNDALQARAREAA